MLYSGIETNSKDRVITVEMARELLGWQEEQEDGPKFGDEYLLMTPEGKKVRCTNNVRNRPLYNDNYRSIKQEILNRRWEFNGEPIIIGKTGLVLNGQHTLIGLIMAEAERIADQNEDEPHWDKVWPEPITIQKLIVYGVDESDRVVDTMDTCKARTLSDVIYRSEFFKSSTAFERKVASRFLDHATKLLWQRLAIKKDPFAPIRTFSEALDFVSRHKKLEKIVSFFLESVKDGEGEDDYRFHRIALYLSPGYAAGMMFLMTASATDPSDYFEAKVSSQKQMDWTNEEKAYEFWTRLTDTTNTKDKEFVAVRKAIGSLEGQGFTGFVPVSGILAYAWEAFLDGRRLDKEPFTKDGFELPTRKRPSDGAKVLDLLPTFGPIDYGSQTQPRGEDDAPTPEELQEAAKKLKAKRTSKLQEIPDPPSTNGQSASEEEKETLRRQKIEETKRKMAEKKKAKEEAEALVE